MSPEERAVAERDILGVRKTIAIGMDIEAFMRSTAGQAIAARANMEMENAQDALAEVDPFDGHAVAKAQMAYRVPAAVLSWLGGFVDEGKAAEIQFAAADAASQG